MTISRSVHVAANGISPSFLLLSCVWLFCGPMVCSLPGSSVHEISQARVLEWFPFPSPGALPDPGIKPTSPALAGGFFTPEPHGKPFILFNASIIFNCVCVCIYHIFFIRSSVNGQLGCYHVLAIVKSATMNIGVHVSFQTMYFCEHIPKSGVGVNILQLFYLYTSFRNLNIL